MNEAEKAERQRRADLEYAHNDKLSADEIDRGRVLKGVSGSAANLPLDAGNYKRRAWCVGDGCYRWRHSADILEGLASGAFLVVDPDESGSNAPEEYDIPA